MSGWVRDRRPSDVVGRRPQPAVVGGAAGPAVGVGGEAVESVAELVFGLGGVDVRAALRPSPPQWSRVRSSTRRVAGCEGDRDPVPLNSGDGWRDGLQGKWLALASNMHQSVQVLTVRP